MTLSAPTTPSAVPDNPPSTSTLRQLTGRIDWRRGGLIAALAVLVIVFTALYPPYLSVQNGINALLGASITAIIAMGQSFVIATSGIDLSVGSVAALAGIVAGKAMNAGLPVSVSLLLALGAGMLAGLINGAIVVFAGITPFMATLGTMSVFSGVALVLSNGRPLYDLPRAFTHPMSLRIATIPLAVWVMIAIAVVLTVALRNSTIGEYALAIGGNEEATRLAGINISAYKLAVYTLSGTTAAIAGILITGRLGTADPTSGTDILLPAIAAAVMGGASLLGGEASVIGAVVGAIVITALQTGLTLLGVTVFVQIIAVGLVIIVAVAADRIAAKAGS
jgi:ribose transport system permease protein